MKVIDIELKNREKRKNDEYIPTILYGKGIKESYPCMVNKKEFIHIVKSNTRNVIFNCKLEDGRAFPSLVKDIQKDVISFEPIHIDFFTISLEEKIQMNIPIYATGEANGVKAGGILEQVTFRLALKGKPTEIPDRLNVDVSDLEIGNSIHAGEIAIQESIELVTPVDTTIFTVVTPKVEEVAPTPTEEVVPATPEAPTTSTGVPPTPK